jgi:hypothetical protein
MASARPRGKSGIQHIAWRDVDGRRRSCSADTTDHRQALALAVERERPWREQQQRVEHAGQVVHASVTVETKTPSSAVGGAANGTNAGKVAKWEKTIRQISTEELADKRIAKSTRDNYGCALTQAYLALDKRADIPAKANLIRQDFLGIRKHLEETLPDSAHAYTKILWRLWKGPASEGYFHLKWLEEMRVAGSGKGSNGRAWTPVERRKLWERLPKERPCWTGMCELGAIGGPQIGDAALLRWSDLKEARNKARFDRIKTRSGAEFGMSKRFCGWAQAQPHEPDDVYVFPEIVFTHMEREANPLCNKQPLDNESDRIGGITSRATAKFRRILQDAGIDDRDLTFKSFRIDTISHLASTGYKAKVLMQVSGQESETQYLTYDRASESERDRAAQRLAEHHEKQLAGKPELVVTTLLDLYELLDTKLQDQGALTVKQLVDLVGERMGKLDDCVGALAARVKSLESQLVRQSAGGGRLAQDSGGSVEDAS